MTKSPSEWFYRPDDGSVNYGWVLGCEVTPLKEPISCKGALGLWEIPPDVLRGMKRQLPGVKLDE